jgi:hypothetical protein
MPRKSIAPQSLTAEVTEKFSIVVRNDLLRNFMLSFQFEMGTPNVDGVHGTELRNSEIKKRMMIWTKDEHILSGI